VPTAYTESPPPVPAEAVGGGGRIGVVALATDLTIESDLRRMAPAGVEIFTNRVRNRDPLTAANLRAMAPDISRAAADLLPGESLDALAYACTSGTAVIGEAEVIRLLRAGRGDPALPCTTPLTAAIAAFAALGARRVSLLTPYTEAVNRALVAALAQRGLTVINAHGFGLERDAAIAEVAPEAIIAAAADACRADAEALFISCTALRAAQVVGRIEARLEKAVVTSNQALLWHALRLVKNLSEVAGFGRLLQH